MRFILSLCLLLMLSKPTYAFDSMDEVREAAKRIVPDDFDDWAGAKRMDWLARTLAATQSPVEVYMLKRLIFHTSYAEDDNKGAARICESTELLADDFFLRLRCIDVMDGIMSHEEALKRLAIILEDAKRLNRPAEIVDALGTIAWIQSQDGEISEALANYAEALETVPKNEERMRFNVLFNLATNYIVHGNDEYKSKGISMLVEIKERGAARATKGGDAEADFFMADSRLAAFNLGIAYTLHLKDYEKAIPEFEYAKSESNRVEALSFAAFAASKVGRFEHAKKLLAEIKGEESRFPIKEGYLKCYRALAVRHWDVSQSLQPCFELNKDTTLEVLLDINQRLAHLRGEPEEIDGLRAFVKMYEEKIEPEYKKRAAKAASNTELKRLETEAKLKDEKIALGEKIKTLLYAVLVISALLLGMMLVVLRSRRIIRTQARDIHMQKLNLQNVLDNIDEGIIAINHKGQISPIYSRHASQILQKDPQGMDLSELLQSIGLDGDALASAQEFFRAVLGEDPISWELNEGLLPRSGFIGAMPFQYYWTPIVFRGRVSEVILSIRDASATMALQKEARTRNCIISVVNAGSLGHNFIFDLNSRLRNLKQGMNIERAAQCLRLAHTIKGEARSFGFTDLQDQLHRFEQALLRETFGEAHRIMDDIQSAAQALQDAFALIKGSDQKASPNPLLGMMQTVLLDAHKRLREVDIELISDLHLNWVDLSEEEISALRDVLVHGVANSIDHGYLIAKRKNMSTDQMARLSIQLHHKGDDIHFSIIDHGVGIDWQALEEIARKRNWTPPKDSDLADIVFMDKVSTVTGIQVSKTSGRGIGMAAVAEAVKSLQGSIKFGPGFNHRGARLDIKWKHKKSSESKPLQAAS